MAKHHAILLQNMLIERGLLVDSARVGCDNGNQSEQKPATESGG